MSMSLHWISARRKVAISYVGSQDQLNDQLAHAGLSLASAAGRCG